MLSTAKRNNKTQKLKTQNKLDKVQTTVRKATEVRKLNKPDLSCTAKMIQPELVPVQRICVENKRPSRITETQCPENDAGQTQLRSEKPVLAV